MIIETNIKSSATEEKEGKKVFKKSLRLNKETIRELRDSDLKRVVGGDDSNPDVRKASLLCVSTGCGAY